MLQVIKETSCGVQRQPAFMQILDQYLPALVSIDVFDVSSASVCQNLDHATEAICDFAPTQWPIRQISLLKGTACCPCWIRIGVLSKNHGADTLRLYLVEGPEKMSSRRGSRNCLSFAGGDDNFVCKIGRASCRERVQITCGALSRN